MPSIRKKTSNRLKIHDRERLKKKVKDNKKKQAKKARKNPHPQWKSKNKDPGIPNEFPYKDQILAEVAETRRLAAEEKERKAEERRLARMKARGIEPAEEAEAAEPSAVDDNDDEPATDGKKDLNVGAEAIAGLGAKVLAKDLKKRPQPEAAVEEEEEDEGEPALVNRELSTLQAVLESSDVLVEVVDARDPLEFRSAALEAAAKAKGMKLAVVLNKIDLCPREAVAAWLAHLRPLYPTFVFKSATAFVSSTTVPAVGKGKAKALMGDAQGADSLLGYLSHLAKAKKGDAPLTVAFAGVTNVGKSSIINSLAKRAAMPVYNLSSTSRGATTTELPQEITLESETGKEIRVIDTPGLAFEYDAEAENKDVVRGRDILMRSRGRIDKLKDPSPPISYLVSRANNEDLMLLYNLAAFAKNHPTAFLSGVARSNQLVKKKGDLDLTTASRVVLRDWSVGKFAHYASPPKPPASPSPEPSSTPNGRGKSRSPKKEVVPPKWLAALYAADDAVVEGLAVRKELRKALGGGLVRMAGGEVDARGVKVEEEWAGLNEEDEDEDEEEDEGAFIGEGDVEAEVEFEDDEEPEDDEDMEDDEEEDEEEGAPEPEPEQKKRKRGAAAPSKAKKVVFASATKGKSKPSKDAAAKKPSSILKPSTAANEDEEAPAARPAKKMKKAAVPPAPKVKKVANLVSAKKANASEPAKDGEEAYDFTKFF